MKYKWIEITDQAPFAPRDGAGALVWQGKMWLLGGWNPNDPENFPLVCSNDVWSSTNGKDWIREKPNTFLPGSFSPETDWEGRHTAGYAVFQDRLWIIGGDPIQQHYQPDVWQSADGREWTRVCAKTPWNPRVLHYTLAFNGRLWVMGGQTLPQFAAEKECFYDDVWSSIDGGHWEKMPVRRPAWSARGMIGGSVVFKNQMWLIGGGTYDTPLSPERNFYHDVWSSADGIHWQQQVAHAPWTPRQYHDVAVFDQRIWVLEGYHTANRNDVWHSADGIHWEELPHTPWAPRHAASVFVYDHALWMVAGNNMQSDVWKLVRC